MQKVAYFRTEFHNTLNEYIIEKTKQGYVLAGPVRYFVIPRWYWLGFAIGGQGVFEVTLVLDLDKP